MIEIGKKGNYLISAVLIAASLIVLRPALAYLLSRRGGDYMSASLVRDALRSYRKAVIFDEKDIDSRNWLAYCYTLTGQTDKAVVEYKKAIEIDPDDVVALFDLGMIYRKAGDLKTAKEYLIKASLTHQSPNVSDQNYRFYTKSAKTMLGLLEKDAAKLNLEKR